MGTVAASGAYMASLAADYIIAKNGTITGSIGVMLKTYEYFELAKKLGITFKTFTAGKHKGIPSPTRSVPDATEDIINKSLHVYHDSMINTVAERRNISLQKARELSTGEVMLGLQAIKENLIDEISYNENAPLDWLQKEKGIDTSINIIDISLEDNRGTNGKDKKLTSMVKYYFDTINNIIHGNASALNTKIYSQVFI